MARVGGQRQSNNFVGGLVTEANPLNFPENSLSQAMNVVINSDGSLEARKPFSRPSGAGGLNIFDLPNLFSEVESVAVDDFETYYWEENNALIQVVHYNFSDTPTRDRAAVIIYQVEAPNLLYRNSVDLDLQYVSDFSRDFSVTFDEDFMYYQETGRTVGLYDFKKNTFVDISTQFGISESSLIYRDFRGVPNYEDNTLTNPVEDSFRPDTNPDSSPLDHISAFRLYNLYNAGWPTEEVEYYEYNPSDTRATSKLVMAVRSAIQALTSERRWPAITDSFLENKVEAATDASLLGLVDTNSIAQDVGRLSRSAPRGKIIRTYSDTTYSITGTGEDLVYDSGPLETEIRLESELNSFSYPDHSNDPSVFGIRAMSILSGRMWYAVGGREFNIMYSQSKGTSKIDWFRRCMQEADPTNPDINEVIDTDGGTLSIKGTGRIFDFLELGKHILVIAENGVWDIKSASRDGAFRPTDFAVERIASYRGISRRLIKQIPGGVMVGCEEGLFLFALNQFGEVQETDLSTQRIKAKWVDFIRLARRNRKIGMEYNSVDNQLIVSSSTTTDFRNKPFNTSAAGGLYSLVLSLSTGAFYEWEVDPCDFNNDQIFINFASNLDLRVPTGYIYLPGSGMRVMSFVPKVEFFTWDRTIIADNGDYFFLYGEPLDIGNIINGRLVSRPIDLLCPDNFQRYDSIGEVPYDTIGNASVDKIVEQSVFFMENIEFTSQTPWIDGFAASGARLSWKWGFDKDYNTDKVVTLGRIKKYPLQENFDQEVVLADKNKLSGKGKALSIKFNRIPDHNNGYKILGYIIDYTGADRP